MKDVATVQFNELEIRIGQSIQIIPDAENTKDFYECVVIGAIVGESFIVTAPASGVFPNISDGQSVILRVFTADGIGQSNVRVLYVSDIPTFMVYLDFPSNFLFRRIRNSKRVKTALPILVTGSNPNQPRGVPGKIVDVSMIGAGIELFDDVGEVDDTLMIKGKFKVGSIQRILSLEAKVRSKSSKGNSNFFFGVEFSEADEDEMLILFGFIFNAMVVGESQSLRDS